MKMKPKLTRLSAFPIKVRRPTNNINMAINKLNRASLPEYSLYIYYIILALSISTKCSIFNLVDPNTLKSPSSNTKSPSLYTNLP